MLESEIIRVLFESVVPERVDEVMELVEKYNSQFRRIPDKPGFHLNAGAYSIVQFTNRSMQQLWIFGHAGWLAQHCFMGFIFMVQSLGVKLEMKDVESLFGYKKKYKEYSYLLGKLEEYSKCASENDFQWPHTVSKPELGRSYENVELAFVFDLTCMATVYLFLHEMKHVLFAVEDNAPDNLIEEEYACDQYAWDMMINQIDQYAKQSGFSNNSVKTKRTSSIALALAFILFATPKHLIAGSETHPPVYDRWRALMKMSNLPENDTSWLIFASLTVALLKYLGIPIPAMKVETYMGFCFDLSTVLEISIKRSKYKGHP